MRHQHGVTAMKWCAWLLLALTAVFLGVYWVWAVPAYGEVTPLWVAVSLSSVVIWTWVTWGCESVSRSAFALVMSLLYCLLTLPYTAYHLFGVGRSTTSQIRSYPNWAVHALIAVWIVGWLVGALFALRVAYRRLRRSHA